jgi:hypothetical protein
MTDERELELVGDVASRLQLRNMYTGKEQLDKPRLEKPSIKNIV